jgi:hypothetical protein
MAETSQSSRMSLPNKIPLAYVLGIYAMSLAREAALYPIGSG